MEQGFFDLGVERNLLLREKYIEPPFSVLDTKTGSWQQRKRKWIDLGIKSEVGRGDNLLKHSVLTTIGKDTSTFDPVLCELMYNWFCPEKGNILDPFSGGSVRGITAHYLGYRYTGIELRQEQIDSNREQALDILKIDNQPNYYVGDAEKELDGFIHKFDFLFSCPPYGDLEKYSNLPDDLSNMNYENFLIKYKNIIQKSCDLLKNNSYACFVVGDFRDKKGNYRGFVADTIKIFQLVGMNFYNDMILLNSVGSACLRVDGAMKNKKIVKIHQNVLIFRKD